MGVAEEGMEVQEEALQLQSVFGQYYFLKPKNMDKKPV